MDEEWFVWKTARDISLWKRWWPLEGPIAFTKAERCSEVTKNLLGGLLGSRLLSGLLGGRLLSGLLGWGLGSLLCLGLLGLGSSWLLGLLLLLGGLGLLGSWLQRFLGGRLLGSGLLLGDLGFLLLL